MLIGFAKHGTGSSAKPVGYLTAEAVSSGPLRYLTGDRARRGIRRQPAPVIVRGDPVRTRMLIDSLRFKYKYTSGVLSFAPGETIPPAVEQRLMDEFERCAFAGLDWDRYDILWVRHRHTASHRHELHFLIPRVELRTGKSLNIAPPGKASRELFDTLRSRINSELGLADPDDPARARRDRLPRHLAKVRALCDQARGRPSLEPRGRAQARPPPNPGRAAELGRRLDRLVLKRAAYHHKRYAVRTAEPLIEREPTAQPPPRHDRTRTPPVGRPAASRERVPRARSAHRLHVGRLEQAAGRWSRAHRDLDLAGDHLGRACRAFADGLEQAVATCERRQTTAALLRRYSLTPTATSPDHLDDRDFEPEMDRTPEDL